MGSEFVSLLFLEKHINDNRKKWVWEGIGCPLVAVRLFPAILTLFNPWTSSNTAACTFSTTSHSESACDLTTRVWSCVDFRSEQEPHKTILSPPHTHWSFPVLFFQCWP